MTEMEIIAELMGYVTEVDEDFNVYIFDPLGNRFMFDPEADCALREKCIEHFGLNVFYINEGTWRVTLHRNSKLILVDTKSRMMSIIKALYEIAEHKEYFE